MNLAKCIPIKFTCIETYLCVPIKLQNLANSMDKFEPSIVIDTFQQPHKIQISSGLDFIPIH